MEEKEKIIKDLKDIPEVDDITITAGGKSVKKAGGEIISSQANGE